MAGKKVDTFKKVVVDVGNWYANSRKADDFPPSQRAEKGDTSLKASKAEEGHGEQYEEPTESVIISPGPERDFMEEEKQKRGDVKKRLAELYGAKRNLPDSVVDELKFSLQGYDAIKREIVMAESAIYDLEGKIRVKKERLPEKLGWLDRFVLRKKEEKNRELEREIEELVEKKKQKERSLLEFKKAQREAEKKMKERPSYAKEKSNLSSLAFNLSRENKKIIARDIEFLKDGIKRIEEEMDSLTKWDMMFFPWKKKRLKNEINDFKKRKEAKEKEIKDL